MNFITYASGPYSALGGGSVALHKLAHNIASLGEKSFIVTDSKNPDYLGEQITEEQGKELAKEGIVIYPEVIIGNPLNAEHVMRWILLDVRHTSDYGIFGERDLIYKYAQRFTLRREQPVNGELRAMELNLDVFFDRKEERSGTCYLYKKCGHKKNVHPEDSIFIDSYAQRGGNEYLSDMFNYSEALYAYDAATFISVQAALCGCLSIVIPDENVSAEKWYSEFPYFKYGIAYGTEQAQIGHAKNTLHLVKDNLLELEKETIDLTKSFIETAYKTKP